VPKPPKYYGINVFETSQDKKKVHQTHLKPKHFLCNGYNPIKRQKKILNPLENNTFVACLMGRYPFKKKDLTNKLIETCYIRAKTYVINRL
jgi:hypothetical protein